MWGCDRQPGGAPVGRHTRCRRGDAARMICGHVLFTAARLSCSENISMANTSGERLNARASARCVRRHMKAFWEESPLLSCYEKLKNKRRRPPPQLDQIVPQGQLLSTCFRYQYCDTKYRYRSYLCYEKNAINFMRDNCDSRLFFADDAHTMILGPTVGKEVDIVDTST